MDRISKDIHTIVSKYYHRNKIWLIMEYDTRRNLNPYRTFVIESFSETHAIYRMLQEFLFEYISFYGWSVCGTERDLLCELGKKYSVLNCNSCDTRYDVCDKHPIPSPELLKIYNIHSYEDFDKTYRTNKEFYNNCSNMFRINEIKPIK